MRRLLLAFIVLLTLGVSAQERVDLTTPETKPSNANYHVDRVELSFDAGLLYVYLKGVNGETRTCMYSDATTPTGTFLLTALNKANLSAAYAGNATTGTLKQRIFHRLVVMGEGPAVCGITLAGAVAGSVP